MLRLSEFSSIFYIIKEIYENNTNKIDKKYHVWKKNHEKPLVKSRKTIINKL